MTQRVLLLAAVVLTLAGLIVYSQYRPPPNRASGFIEADEIRLGSRVGGRVHAVHVDEGARVRQGQVLVQLEPYDLLQRENEAVYKLAQRDAEYRQMVAGLRPEEIGQAKARLDQLQAQLDLLEAGPRAQEIDAARGRLRAAQAELTLAKQNFDRTASLFETKVATREEFDSVAEKRAAALAMFEVRQQELELLEIGTRQEEIRQARAHVDEARQAWQLAEKGYRPEQIEQAQAARDAAQAALDVIRQQIKELTILSPEDGVIEALDLQEGDLVAAGAPVLSLLIDRRLWVRTYVPQNRVGLRVGQKLWVAVDGLGGEKFPGEITFIARQAEFTPSNVQTPEERSKQVFRIKVTLKQGIEKLRPGMSAEVWLDPVSDGP